jgi:hypothetical protein
MKAKGHFLMKKYKFIPIILLALFLIPRPGRAQVEESAARVLWRMINQARANPMDTIRSLGIDEEAARQSLGTDQWIIDEGLPPFAWNGKLAETALQHGSDMIAHVYYSTRSLDGSNPGDRMRSAGIEPISEGELLGVLAFGVYIDPAEAAKIVFENWVRDEFNPARQSERRIFDADCTEMGIALIGAVLHLDGEIPPNVFVAVADFAEPAEARRYVVGNVFRDLNGNGRMDQGEAVAGATVVLRGIGSQDSTRVVTGLSGEYQADLPRRQLIIFDVSGAQGPLITGFLAAGGADQNRLIDLQVP